MMKLYTYDPAPNPQRLSHFMRHKGIEIDTLQVDLATAEQLTEEHLAVNPGGTVPALVLEDGTVLSAVIGIVTYLEALHPEKPLLGTDALERARVISWCHDLFNGLFTSIAHVFRNRTEGMAGRALPGPLNLPQIPELIERGNVQIDYFLPQIDRHLADNNWLAGGDAPSFADIDLLVATGFLAWIRRDVPPQCQHLLAWRERAQAAFS